MSAISTLIKTANGVFSCSVVPQYGRPMPESPEALVEYSPTLREFLLKVLAPQPPLAERLSSEYGLFGVPVANQLVTHEQNKA